MTETYTKVPPSLRSYPQWVVWRREERDGKATKIPYIPSNGSRASSTDPQTWGTFEAARARTDLDGVGFVFSDQDPFVGIDLDNCFDDQGRLHPAAAKIVQDFDSYTERSPSRRGLHIFIEGSLGDHKRNRTKQTPWRDEIEIYGRHRYFTVTGDHLEGTPLTVESRQEQLDALMVQVFPPTPEPVQERRPVVLDVSDDELIEKAKKAKNGASFQALWAGDTSAHGGDDSAADMALCSHLAFWAGGDEQRIDRLFRGSGLFREKWNRADYRDRTIKAAVERCRDFYTPPTEPTEPGSVPSVGQQGTVEPDDDKPERKSAATTLIEIALEHYDFGISDAGETFGVPKSGPKIVRMLRGGKTSLRAQLSHDYFSRYGKAAPQQGLADALLTIEGMAQDADEERLFMRVARHGKDLWLDLGDATGRAVRVSAEGWSVEQSPPVLFKRTSLTGPIPVPSRGGSLEELWSFLPVGEQDRSLVLARQVAALDSEMPQPVLATFGEQGTGKTTTQKVLVLMLDPGPVPTRKPPRDAESWVTAASGSWAVGLDNLSDIPAWLSDAICRAVTGDGDVRRKLYTDADFAVFAFRRCVYINGIDVGALRGDLAERLLPVDLKPISEKDRLPEEDLWPRWEQAHPRILGALLDLAAGVAGVLPSVRLATSPRMADFARVLAAVDQILDTKGLERYHSRSIDLAADGLSGDAFAGHIRGCVTEMFEGTSAELLELVQPRDEKWRPPKGYPADARQATARLRRLAPLLRKVGWVVDDLGNNNHEKVVRWKLTPPEKAGKDTRAYPQPPQLGVSAGVAGVGGGPAGPSQADEPDSGVGSPTLLGANESHPATEPMETAPHTRNCSACGERATFGDDGLCGPCREDWETAS